MSEHKFSKQAELDFMHNFRHDTEGDRWAKHEIELLRQQLVEYQTKHDVACSTITLLQEKCEVRGKALASQCEETKELRQQVTLLRCAMEAAWRDTYGFCGAEGLSDAQKQFQAVFAATEPKL